MAHIGFVSTSVLESKDGVSLCFECIDFSRHRHPDISAGRQLLLPGVNHEVVDNNRYSSDVQQYL